MAPNIASLGECFMCTSEEMCFLLLWVECSVNVKLLYSVVQVFYIFADLLRICSIQFWNSMCISPTIMVDLPFFSFHVYLYSYIMTLLLGAYIFKVVIFS